MLALTRSIKISLTFLLVLAASSCAPKIEKEVQFLEIDDFSSYVSPGATSPQIQKASLAVVRVNDSGTGFFVSDSGHMMTNNHVIGRHNCPLTGCFVRIDLKYQSNLEYSKDNTKTLFAKPLSTSEELDFTLVQLFNVENAEPTQPFDSPDFLEIETKSAKELINQQIFIIGHPLAEMKKVKTVEGYAVVNGFIRMDDYVFGGNSGSPLVNDSGNVVGILHSGEDASHTISRNGLQGFSNGTASKDILQTMKIAAAEIKDTVTQDDSAREGFIDLDSDEFDFDKHSSLVLAAARLPLHTTPISPAKPTNPTADQTSTPGEQVEATPIKGSLAPVKDNHLKGIAKLVNKYQLLCEAVVDAENVSIIDYAQMTRVCFAKTAFINCESKQKYLYCPQDEEKKKWQELAVKIYEKNLTTFNKLDMKAIFLQRKFIADKDEKAAFTQKMVKDFVERTGVSLNFRLATNLIYRDLPDYMAASFEQTPARYVMDFRTDKFHGKSLLSIGLSHLKLYSLKVITSTEHVRAVFGYILGHRDITARDRFALESYAYEGGILVLN